VRLRQGVAQANMSGMRVATLMWESSTEDSSEKASSPRDQIVYTTKPLCWPIRDTDEGRCRVLPSVGPLQVVCVRGKTLHICSQSLWMFSVHSSLRQRILEIVEWKWFERFILFLILLNSILLAAYQYRAEDDNDFNYFVDKIADPIFTVFFSLECVMKIIAVGLFFDRNAYLRDAWNAFDFVVVASALVSLIIGGDKLNILRVFRVLRPLRSINALPDLKRYVLTMLNSIPQLVDVSIMGLSLYLLWHRGHHIVGWRVLPTMPQDASSGAIVQRWSFLLGVAANGRGQIVWWPVYLQRGRLVWWASHGQDRRVPTHISERELSKLPMVPYERKD